MDDRRFDQWTRSFDALPSRRAMAKLLTGSLLSTLLTPFGADEAAAKCVKPSKKCDRKNPKKDKCCGGAKCRGKLCRCPRGRAACGKTCCAKGQLCLDGQCVTGRADCPAGANTCVDGPRSCANNPNCFCVARLQGGTRCGQFLPEGSSCGQCQTDDDCRTLGFPLGSSCIRNDGPLCCPGDPGGMCFAPCGFLFAS